MKKLILSMSNHPVKVPRDYSSNF